MKKYFYKLAVRGLIARKYPSLVLRDLFWDYDVNEDADRFLIEFDNLNSSDGRCVRIQFSRHVLGKEHSFLETMALVLESLDSVLEWYTVEYKGGET